MFYLALVFSVNGVKLVNLWLEREHSSVAALQLDVLIAHVCC